MIKFRLYLDKDKETVWLNEMSAQGWAMKSFFAGFYQFEKCEKGAYVYQIDFGSRLFAVSEDYREFMQDAGIEVVQIWGYWIILRKKASEGKFELYTDVSSNLEHYKKIRRMFKVVTIIELICLFMELYVGFVQGIRLGAACSLLIGAIFVGCINILVRLNDRIGRLQEQQNGLKRSGRCRKVSALMVAGLLLNSFVILVEEMITHPVKIFMQMTAIILMIGGLFITCRGRE